jgi:hypothetical protein
VWECLVFVYVFDLSLYRLCIFFFLLKEMEKPEHEVYNELKKVIDPHKTALEALTRKKDVSLADVEKAKDDLVCCSRCFKV